jgi:predicted  nucleic acid-binding Zn-ribbon protein
MTLREQLTRDCAAWEDELRALQGDIAQLQAALQARAKRLTEVQALLAYARQRLADTAEEAAPDA